MYVVLLKNLKKFTPIFNKYCGLLLFTNIRSDRDYYLKSNLKRYICYVYV